MKVFSCIANPTLLMSLVVIFLVANAAYSQFQDAKEQPPPPSEESFRPSTDLLVPWRHAGCFGLDTPQNSPCHREMTAVQYTSSTILTLYDDDASVWKTFDLDPRGALFFERTKDLVPFATPGVNDGPPYSVWLRITGESDHWYKVVGNEDSGQTVYALKSKSLEWSRTTFDYWFNRFPIVHLSKDLPPLLDAPNGKPVSETEFMHFEAVNFVKLDRPDGEWIYVETRDRDLNPKPYRGWIRWRDGRKVLVGCVFSNTQFALP